MVVGFVEPSFPGCVSQALRGGAIMWCGLSSARRSLVRGSAGRFARLWLCLQEELVVERVVRTDVVVLELEAKEFNEEEAEEDEDELELEARSEL